MIRASRVPGAISLLAVVALAGATFGLRPHDSARADPLLEAGREGQLAAVASAADAALARLADGLASALDAARRGSALTVAGDEPPAPKLVAAAVMLQAASADADASRRALGVLAGTIAALAPGTPAPGLPFGASELLEVAAQLRAAADAATVFVGRRDATVTVVEGLGAGLAELDAGQPAAALAHLEASAVALASLDDWQDPPQLLTYWMSVIGRLVDAARDIAVATIDGDTDALVEAAVRYRDAAELARGADNALAVALSEAGAAVSATPLQRLAALVGGTADARAAVAPWLAAARV